MKDLISAHGVQATILLVLICFNAIMTAISTCLDKIESYLSPDPNIKPDPNSSVERIKSNILKLVGWSQTIIDWIVGNKEH